MADNPGGNAPRSAARSLAREREIYERIVATMGYPEPSMIANGLRSGAPKRFSPKQLLPMWEAAAADPRRGEGAWNMYIHVPFCKSICTFCNYRRLRVSSRDGLQQYVDFVAAEAELFGAALKGTKFGAIYVGGGTPSVLAADQLDRLFDALHENFEFEDRAQKNFEYDPMVMTEDRFEVIQRHGFTRFSFGIQSSDVEVNEQHGRGRQKPTHVARQFELLDRFGAASVNVDFLLGLHGTTPEKMLAEIEGVLRDHRPDEVAIYFVFPTAEYLARHFEGDHERFQRFIKPFEEQCAPALQAMCDQLDYAIREAGKHVILLQSQRPSPRGSAGPSSEFGYCDVPSMVHRPLQLLGFGDSARSRIFGQLMYWAEHDHDLRNPNAARYAGVPTTVEDEIFDYVALVFRDGDRLSRPLFRRTFGDDITTVYRTALIKLSELGALRVHKDAVVFEPQDRKARLRDLMFFLPKRRRRQIATFGDWNVPKLTPKDATAKANERLRVHELRTAVAPLVPGSEVEGGFTVTTVSPPGLVLRREQPSGQVLVQLLQPAGTHPACRRSDRFDLQYEVQEGFPAGPDLDRMLDAVTAVLRRNERGLPVQPVVLTEEERAWYGSRLAEARAEGPLPDLEPDAAGDHPLRDWFLELAQHPRVREAIVGELGPGQAVVSAELRPDAAETLPQLSVAALDIETGGLRIHRAGEKLAGGPALRLYLRPEPDAPNSFPVRCR